MIYFIYFLFLMGFYALGFFVGRKSLFKDISKIVSQRYDAEVRNDTMKYLRQFELMMVKKEEDP